MEDNVTYLVDTENVGIVWKSLVKTTSNNTVYVFYTDKSPHISYNDLVELMNAPLSFKAIKCFPGTNGLDFQLVSYLGFLIHENPEQIYVIVSKDKGFDSVCKFWTNQKCHVSRSTLEPKVEPVVKQTAATLETASTNTTNPKPSTAAQKKEFLQSIIPENYKKYINPIIEVLKKQIIQK